MKNITIAAFSALALSGFSAHALELKDGEDKFKVRGYARLALEFPDGKRPDLTNYASRIGFDYDRAANDKVTVGAQFEWGVNMLHGSKISSDQDGDGGNSNIGTSGNFLSNRLGNVVVKTNYGALRAGKQWSVYSEVADWTDQFATGSSEALGIYSYGTDGGYLGTGRADNALTYRYEAKGLKLGLQYQAMGSDAISNVGVNEGAYGLNAIYNFMESFHVGIAYNQVNMKFTDGGKLTPKSMVFGFKFINEKFNIALAHAELRDSDSSSSTLTRTSIFEKASGTEVYFDYKFYKKFSVELGYDYLTQKNAGNDYKVDFFLLGLKETTNFGVYGIMAKIDNSKDSSGMKVDDNFVSTYIKYNF
jgi:hypothetical protein